MELAVFPGLPIGLGASPHSAGAYCCLRQLRVIAALCPQEARQQTALSRGSKDGIPNQSGETQKESIMSNKAAEHHRKASEHSSQAARHHEGAAKQHEAGHHEKAAPYRARYFFP